MKKVLSTFIAVVLAVGVTMAQKRGSIRLGAGVVYGTKAGVNGAGSEKGGVGFYGSGEYFLTDKISVAPAFTYFVKSEIGGTNAWGTYKGSVQYSIIDVDGRYNITAGGFNLYGLAGISSAKAKVRSSSEGDNGSFSSSETNRDTGFNLGAGVSYPINEHLNLNGQIKYNTPMKQIALQTGVYFVVK